MLVRGKVAFLRECEHGDSGLIDTPLLVCYHRRIIL